MNTPPNDPESDSGHAVPAAARGASVGASARVDALLEPGTRGDRRGELRRRIGNLVELLDDPSPTVWTGVRRELERLAKPAAGMLKRACDDPAPIVRSRARALLATRGREAVLRRMIAFASRRTIDLETGLFLLARMEKPDLDVRACMLQLDAFAAEVLARVESVPPTLERPLALVQYLGRELGFRGDSDDYHHPDNIYLHRALERRRGIPLTLAAIYRSVARRAGIDAALVPVPGHVMLRVRGGGKSALIDVFQNGERRTEREMLQYLAEMSLPFQPSWFRDADDASMFQRQVANLKNSYAQRGLTREARGLAVVIDVLQRRAQLLAAGARI